MSSNGLYVCGSAFFATLIVLNWHRANGGNIAAELSKFWIALKRVNWRAGAKCAWEIALTTALPCFLALQVWKITMLAPGVA